MHFYTGVAKLSVMFYSVRANGPGTCPLYGVGGVCYSGVANVYIIFIVYIIFLKRQSPELEQ